MKTAKSKAGLGRPACVRNSPNGWPLKGLHFQPNSLIHKRCTNADRSNCTGYFRDDPRVSARLCGGTSHDDSSWDGSRGRTDPKVVDSEGGDAAGDCSKGVA